MTLREIYREVRGMLEKAGIDNAGFEADVLLRHATGCGRFDAGEVDEAGRAAVLALARRRASREPLQYIVGRWPFLGLELEVGPGVLIPRPETEEIGALCAELWLSSEARKQSEPTRCEATPGAVCASSLSKCSERGVGGALCAELWLSEENTAHTTTSMRGPDILDLCSGSGVLALGLKSLLPGARVTAVEWDADALVYLRRNAETFARESEDGEITVVQADALQYWRELAESSLDMIVCNPPYVTEAEYAELAPELYHEPKRALVGAIAEGWLCERSEQNSPNPRPANPPKGGEPQEREARGVGGALDDGLLFYRVITPRYFLALRPGGYLVFEIGAKQGTAVRAIMEKAGYVDVQVRTDMAGCERVVIGGR